MILDTLFKVFDKIHDIWFGSKHGEFAMSHYSEAHKIQSMELTVIFLGVIGVVTLMFVLLSGG